MRNTSRLLLTLCLLTAACEGVIDAGPDPDQMPDIPVTMPPPVEIPTPELCAEREIETGLAPMTRLTREQYVGLVRMVLHVDAELPEVVSDEAIPGTDFASNLSPLSTVDHVRPFAGVAREVADAIDLVRVYNCADLTGEDCVRHFFTPEQRGSRLIRRPVMESEVEAYMSLYRAMLADEGDEAARRSIIEAILQSPAFLYHALPSSDVGTAPVDAFALAARLSFFLWNEAPDNPLYRSALSGELLEEGQLRLQAERLLDDEKAHDAVLRFVRRWLSIEDVGGIDENLLASMNEENRLFIEHVVWEEDLPWQSLLTSEITFVDARLHEHYGLSGAPPAEFTEARFDTTRRLGILGQGLYLAGSFVENPKGDRYTIMQGKNVTTRFLCDNFERPSLPADARQPSDFESMRGFSDYLIGRGDSPSCAGTCHQRMDPLGRAFSHFDHAGAYIEVDHDTAFMEGVVDATGEILIPPAGAEEDLVGEFYGQPGLAQHLAQSEWVERCFVRQMIRFSLGRAETDADMCGVLAIQEDFRSAGGSVRDLVLAVIDSPVFRYANNEPAGDVTAPETCQ